MSRALRDIQLIQTDMERAQQKCKAMFFLALTKYEVIYLTKRKFINRCVKLDFSY